MRLKIVDENGEEISLGLREGDTTTVRMLEIFEECINLQRQKASTYGDAFRSQGYMGNVARVLSKAARLKNMVWTDAEFDSPGETTRDTVLDMINIACFFIINKTDRNKWGREL